MDTNFWQDMSKGQQVTAAGGATALVASFLPWYVLKDRFIDNVSLSGTDFTFGWLGMVLLVAAAGLTVAPAFGKDLGTIVAKDKVAGEQIAIAAAGVGSVLWLIRFVQVPALYFDTMGRGIGLFLAMVAAAAVTVGVVMTMKEKGIPMPNGATIAALRADSVPGPATPHTPAPAPVAYQPPVPQAPQAHTPPAPAPQAHTPPAPAPQAHTPPAPAPQAHTPPAPAPQARPMQDGRF